MSKTEVSGKQVKDGSIELVDLSTELANNIAAKAESSDVTALDARVTAVESDVSALQSAAAPNLSDLGEVSINSPAAGQVLKYNGTGWANAADSTFSGSYTDLSDKPSLFDGNYSSLSGAPSLASVATSGSYNDLSDKPSIPSITGLATETYVDTAVSGKADSSSLAAVATSGSYVDLTNKPSLFSGSYTDLTDKPSLFSGSYTDLSNKPSLFDGAYSSLSGTPNLATVATSGSYTDLTDKPSIPSITGLATETYVNNKVADLVASAPSTLDTLNELAVALGNDANFSTTITNAIAAKADSSSLATVATSGSYADLTNKPSLFDGNYSSLSGAPNLATVATSGSYADLSNKPTLGSFTTLTSPASGQFLSYNGSAWINSALPVASTGVSGIVNLTSQNLAGTKTFVGEGGGVGGGSGAEIRLGSAGFMTWAPQYSRLYNSGGYLNIESSNSDTPVRFRSQGDGFNNWNLAITRNLTSTTFDFVTSSFAGGPTPTVNITNTLGVGLTDAIGSRFQVNAGSATTKGVIVRGATSQTANLFEAQNSAGTAITTINASGTIENKSAAYTSTLAPGGLDFYRSRSSTIGGTPTIVNNGDYLGSVQFWGANGSTFNRAASIAAAVDGAPGVSGDMPCRIEFYTTADGNGDLVAERMRLNSAGNLGIGTTGNPGARLHVDLAGNGNAAAPGTKGMLVRGASSQTANLFEIIRSNNTALFAVSPDGIVGIGTSSLVDATGILNIHPQIAGWSSNISFRASTNAFANEMVLGQGGDNVAYMLQRGNNALQFGTNGTARLRILGTGEIGINETSPGSQLQITSGADARKVLIVKGAAAQSANLFEVQNNASTILCSIAANGTLNVRRYTETSTNAFNTTLAPSSGTLTVDTSVGNAVLGALSASITTWAFTNVPTENSRVTKVTVVLDGTDTYTYGDACSVNGNAVTDGVMWSGGSAPTATNNFDIIEFTIVKDSAGTFKVFGVGTTNFS